MLLHKNTWPQIKAHLQSKENPVALVPIGSTEQHGLHDPLGVDHLIAEAVARAAAERANILCCPTLPIGLSTHHRQFTGTLWLSTQTFQNMLEDVVRALAYHGVRRVVFVNGHGGNTAAALDLAGRLRRDGLYCFLYEWFRSDLTKKYFDEPDSHAGADETSVILALYPDLVNLDAAKDAHYPEHWGLLLHGAEVGFDTIDFSPNGAVGRIDQADAEKGKALMNDCVAQLCELIAWVESRTEEELKPKPPV